MAKQPCVISNICRFCLCQDTYLLIPMSQRIDTAFTLQDIERYTGIRIPEEEKYFYAICETCCCILNKSITFRCCCLSNDTLFNQLFSTFVEKNGEKLGALQNNTLRSMNLAALEIEIVLQDDHTINESNNGSPNNDEFDARSVSSNDESSLSELPTLTKDESVPRSKRVRTEAIDSSGKLMYDTDNRTGKSRNKKLCGTCGVLVYDLISHVRIHTKEKFLACSLCPIKMANRANLLRHVQAVHAKMILKSCELCGKGFTSSNSYKSHQRSHHGIGETYDCKICSKSFNHPSNYKQHFNRLHNVKKDYKCRICGKLFKDRSGWKAHRRVHSASKPFACNQCPKRFKSLYARNTHQWTHSGIRFRCELCEKSYQYKSLLATHYKKHHPNVEIPNKGNNPDSATSDAGTLGAS